MMKEIEEKERDRQMLGDERQVFLNALYSAYNRLGPRR